MFVVHHWRAKCRTLVWQDKEGLAATQAEKCSRKITLIGGDMTGSENRQLIVHLGANPAQLSAYHLCSEGFQAKRHNPRPPSDGSSRSRSLLAAVHSIGNRWRGGGYRTTLA
jgi:hypothetical protein